MACCRRRTLAPRPSTSGRFRYCMRVCPSCTLSHRCCCTDGADAVSRDSVSGEREYYGGEEDVERYEECKEDCLAAFFAADVAGRLSPAVDAWLR